MTENLSFVQSADSDERTLLQDCPDEGLFLSTLLRRYIFLFY